MKLLKKLKHKSKPNKITPIVHHIAPPPPPPPKKVIHEIRQAHVDKKNVTAAKETNKVVVQPAAKEIIEIAEITNEVVIQPAVKEVVKIAEETNEEVIKPVISSDDKKLKKKINQIVEETTTIAPFLIAAGGVFTLYMIM